MRHLLESIYQIGCFITEDAVAHGLTKNIPEDLMKDIHELVGKIETYLEETE